MPSARQITICLSETVEECHGRDMYNAKTALLREAREKNSLV